MSELVKTRIGVLPREWRVQPLVESTTKIQDGTHFSPTSEDGPFRYVTSKNIHFGKLDLSDCGWISQQEHDAIYARCDVKYGDLLLTKDGANTGNASLNDQHEPFSLLSSVAILRTDGVAHHAGFILQYLLSPLGQRRLKDLMSGNAITRLTLQKIKAFETPVPSATEQRRIAEILSTLDETIEQTEALIAKYQQIKAGLMHDLFTRGVTPDGKLRPTRAEAPQLYKESSLGWIPKEWEEMTFQRLLSTGTILEIQDGNHGEQHPKTSDFVAEGLPFIMANDLIDGRVVFENCYRISRSMYRSLRVGFARELDVLLTHKGTVGRTAVIPENYLEVMLTPQVTYYRTKTDSALRPRFLYCFFQSESFQRVLANLSEQTTRKYIGITEQKRCKCMIPPVSEQEQIETRILGLEELLFTEKERKAKLMLQKQGLMHDLLTGRVRVKMD